MLIVIAFCSRDAGAAINLLNWIHELDGPDTKHRFLLVASATMPPQDRSQVLSSGKSLFRDIQMAIAGQIDERPWPQAPNTMFRCARNYVDRVYGCPFWWNEPDCIPLCSGAYTALEAEYQSCGKPFMGSVVDKPVRHLTGCAVYPHKADTYNSAYATADKLAFDCVNPQLTLKHTHHTNLFHHQWSDWNGQEVPTFPDAAKLSNIALTAVIFHRNKDHTLIDRLRERGKMINAVADAIVASRPNSTPCTLEVASSVQPQPDSPTITETTPAPPPPPVPRLPIYTYYEPVPGQPDATPLIDLWRELWYAQGWSPIILNEAVAAASPQFHFVSQAISKLPTVNHPLYERACYLRHLAMVQSRGGFLTDYDVMPRQFTPVDAREARGDRAITILEPTRVPCAVGGAASGFQRIVDTITGYCLQSTDQYAGKPHTSDMEILRKSHIKCTNHCVEHLCSGSGNRDEAGDGWKTAPMIHFSTYSFHKLGGSVKGTKLDLIRGILASLPPATIKT